MQNVAIKLTINEIAPVMQAAIRSSVASCIILVWMKIRGVRLLQNDGTHTWGLAAGLLFAGQFQMVYWGLEFTSASRAVIFLYLAPFFVAIGSQFFLPDSKLRATQTAGLVVAFSGIAIAFGEALFSNSSQMLIGDAMLVIAALFWASTTIVIKKGPLAQISSQRTLFYQLLVSAPLLFLGSWAIGEPRIESISVTASLGLTYQIAVVACFSYLLWFWLVQQYSAPKLTSFHFLTPLFGVFAGVTVLGEPFSPSFLVAAILVAGGIYLVNRR